MDRDLFDLQNAYPSRLPNNNNNNNNITKPRDYNIISHQNKDIDPHNNFNNNISNKRDLNGGGEGRNKDAQSFGNQKSSKYNIISHTKSSENLLGADISPESSPTSSPKHNNINNNKGNYNNNNGKDDFSANNLLKKYMAGNADDGIRGNQNKYDIYESGEHSNNNNINNHPNAKHKSPQKVIHNNLVNGGDEEYGITSYDSKFEYGDVSFAEEKKPSNISYPPELVI